MGAYDYEIYNTKKSIYPVGEIEEERFTLLQEMQGSTNVSSSKSFSNQYKKYFDDNDLLCKTFNRPVFKTVQLREEIYFVTVLVPNYNTNDKNLFTFCVNGLMLKKRFRVYLENSNQAEDYNKYTLSEYISLLKNNKNRVIIHFWKKELDILEEINKNPNINQQYTKYGFMQNHTIIRIANITHYNKKTMISILNDSDFNNYISESSGSYYDPNYINENYI